MGSLLPLLKDSGVRVLVDHCGLPAVGAGHGRASFAERGYTTPTGWQSNIPTMSICSAEIETSSSPNKQDVLFCRYGSSTCLSNSVMGSLEKHVPNGSCKVNSDKKSFTCVQKIQ